LFRRLCCILRGFKRPRKGRSRIRRAGSKIRRPGPEETTHPRSRLRVGKLKYGVRIVLIEDASRLARQLVTQELAILALTARGVRVLTATATTSPMTARPVLRAGKGMVRPLGAGEVFAEGAHRVRAGSNRTYGREAQTRVLTGPGPRCARLESEAAF
jgi:hypothetical protein